MKALYCLLVLVDAEIAGADAIVFVVYLFAPLSNPPLMFSQHLYVPVLQWFRGFEWFTKTRWWQNCLCVFLYNMYCIYYIICIFSLHINTRARFSFLRS